MTSANELRRSRVMSRYHSVRSTTSELTRGLTAEDMTTQTCADVSPTKWHLGHTTWFFETFVLRPFGDERVHDPTFPFLFNSYYEAMGARQPRAQRGALCRPPLEEVWTYRRSIDERVSSLIESLPESQWKEVEQRIVIGLHHEMQHQELLLMDIKHVLGTHPFPPQDTRVLEASNPVEACGYTRFSGGLHPFGHRGDAFAFDNEGPSHLQNLVPFELADRPVSAEEYLRFVEDDGYAQSELWLSDGWAWVQDQGIKAPLYWRKLDGRWHVFHLEGERPLLPTEPVMHVSFYEADAYARWSGARLPTEYEWEHAASQTPVEGVFLESGRRSPAPVGSGALSALFGDLWELTQSAYAPYPGFRALPGALGEYNGKFMSNQVVLRGGSFATPQSHIRATYRNFFYPHQRWAFQGFRLAKDV
ncbi:MAG: ergothioneine biosynthesis protein EgtB [Myxococcota bacterium]